MKGIKGKLDRVIDGFTFGLGFGCAMLLTSVVGFVIFLIMLALAWSWFLNSLVNSLKSLLTGFL